MEVVQIFEDVQQDWNGVILSDDQGNQYMQDYVTYDNSAEMVVNQQPQLYLLNANNTIVPIDSMDNFAFFADPESDDGEIPPHVLDHMYAKKPREPGSEQAKPVRRRSKKKEQSISQVFVEELIPETPKINIIRQRMPMAQSQFKATSTRPKILQSHSSVGTGSHDTNYLINNPTSSLLAMATTLKASPSTLEYHLNFQAEQLTAPIETKPRLVYDDCEIPQPSEMVTIAEIGKGAIRGRKSKTLSHIRSDIPSTESLEVIYNVQNFAEDQKVSIAMLDEEKVEVETIVPEEELFFDMIEESEGLFTVGMDVDMDDIELGGNNVVVTTTGRTTTNLTFDDIETQPNVRQTRKRRQTPTPQNSISSEPISTNNIKEPNNSSKSPSKDTIAAAANKKHVSWKLDIETDCTQPNLISYTYESDEIDCKVNKVEPVEPVAAPVSPKTALTATRRSTRPVKLPARLEDLEDVALKKKKR